VYSAEEIARAAGVPVGPVVAALGGGSGLVSFADAARVGRALAHGRRPPQATAPRQLFSSLTPNAATLRIDDRPEPMRLVFLVTPGPGGGGGGGGLLQPAPPPKAMREGHQQMSSPIPPKRIVPIPAIARCKPSATGASRRRSISARRWM